MTLVDVHQADDVSERGKGEGWGVNIGEERGGGRG